MRRSKQSSRCRARTLELVAAAAFRLAGSREPDAAVQAAVVRLRDPEQRVERLARDLGLSERQLRRRFEAAVGYGPKMLQRVLRLRRFLASASAEANAPRSLARAALDAGYADQAHLARDCRALTGLAPRQLIAPTGVSPPSKQIAGETSS